MANPTPTIAVAVVVAMCALATTTSTSTTSSGPPPICNVEISDLINCLPAITGKSPPNPTLTCCDVICKADLPCLCKYKAQLAQLGVDPAIALALPGKCGLKLPRKCNRKH